MKYTILIYENETDFATRSDEKRKEAYWGAYRAYTQALTQAGYVIDVPDLDRALDWAARCPAASTGTIEVRPNLPN